MIQVFSNTLGAEELQAVEQAFTSRWLGKGRECDAFEREFLAYRGGVGSMLLTNTCTSAIYIALRALGIGPGDEVIVPTVHFVAVPNAVIDAGARAVFADVDARTLNLLPGEITRLRTPHTKAVFVLHYGGHPCAMETIRLEADGLLILEDAANAVSSLYHGQACGALGDAGVWSFDAMKILVTIDGGALWLKDAGAARRAEMYRYLGLLPQTTSGVEAQKAGAGRWWQFDIGATSGRFISNDVSAAIGRVQLQKLPGFIARRKTIWDTYQREFAGVRELLGVGALELPPEPLPGCTSSYYLYWIQTPRRDALAQYLGERGIYTTFRYYPLHLVPFYASGARLTNAEFAGQYTLCLPIHQNLSDDDVARVIEAVRGFY